MKQYRMRPYCTRRTLREDAPEPADLVRFGAALRVGCTGCGASRTLTAAEAALAFGSTPLTQVQARSKCSRCGVKAAKLIVLPPV